MRLAIPTLIVLAIATPAAAQTPAGDPCSLLSKDEIRAATGWVVAHAEPKSGRGYANCTWSSAKGTSVTPPETVFGGFQPCLTNFPCGTIKWPGSFASSAAMADFRLKVYKGTPYADAGATAVPVEGLGVPAIIHELVGEYSFEAWLGGEKIAFVTLWKSAEAARALGGKLLSRLK
jgi:hypothetical protein